MKFLELFNFLAILAIPGMLWWLHRENRFSIIPILFPSIILCWQGLSVAFLETGVYSPELYMTTLYSGGTIRFVSAVLIFLFSYGWVFNFIVNDNRVVRRFGTVTDRISFESRNMFFVSVAFISGIILFIYAPNGEVLSRSRLLTENPVFIRDFIFKYLPAISFFLGLAAGTTKKQSIRSLCFVILFFYLYILVCYGNKFSGLFGVISFFLIAYYTMMRLFPIKRPVFWITARKQLLIGVLIFTIFMGLGIGKYLGSGGGAEAAQYLFERVLILQGGIWWHTDYVAMFGIDRPGFNDFYSFMKSVEFHPNSSLMYLMTKAIGHELTYKIFFLHGSLYTGAFPAIFYEFFGFLSVIIFSAVSGGCIAFASGYLIRTIVRRNVLLLVGAFYIYVPIVNIMDAGEFLQLFSINLLIKIMLVCMLELVCKVNSQFNTAKQRRSGQDSLLKVPHLSQSILVRPLQNCQSNP